MENKSVNYNVIKLMNNNSNYLSIGLRIFFYTNTFEKDSKYYLYINVSKKDLPEDITEEMIHKLADNDGERFKSLLIDTSDFIDNYCNTIGYTEEKLQKMLHLQKEIDFNKKIFSFLDKYNLEPCSKEDYDLCNFKLEKEKKNSFSFSN